LSNGLITFSDFIELFSRNVTADDTTLYLEGQSGSAWVQGLILAGAADNQGEIVRLLPFQRIAFERDGPFDKPTSHHLPPQLASAVEEYAATGFCVCPVCECEPYNLPPLSKSQTLLFCSRACELLDRHQNDYSECASEWSSCNNRGLIVGSIGLGILIFTAPKTAGMSLGAGAVAFAAGVVANAQECDGNRENCEEQADDLLVTQLETQCELRRIDSSH
jgi:hypothetical protein